MRRILLVATFVAALAIAAAVTRLAVSTFVIADAPTWIADGTDAHGDPLPAGAVARLGTVRFRTTTRTNVVWLDDGRIAAGGFDQEIVIWDAETGARTQVLPGHRTTLVKPADQWSWHDARRAVLFGRPPTASDQVAWLGVTGDGSRLLSAGGTIREWDLATGEGRLVVHPRHRLGADRALRLVEGGTVLQESTPFVVRRIDLASGAELRRLPFESTDGLGATLATAADKGIVALQADDSGISLADTDHGVLEHVPAPLPGVAPRAVCFDRDAVTLWCVWNRYGGPGERARRRHSLLTAIDVATRAEIARDVLTDDAGQWWRIACSPDGRLLALSTLRGRVEVRDAVSLALVRVIDTFPAPVAELSFAPDSRRLVLLVGGCAVSIADVVTGTRHTLAGAHEAAVGCVAFLDDACVVTSAYDGAIRAWEARTGRVLWERRGGDLAFLARAPQSGRLACVGDAEVLALRASDGSVVTRRAVPEGWRAHAPAPDGTLLVENATTLSRLGSDGAVPRTIAALGEFESGAERRVEAQVIAWDPATGRILLQDTTYRLLRTWTSPDGYERSSWSGSPSLRLVDARDGRTLWRHKGSAELADFAGDRVLVPHGRDTLVLGADGRDALVLEDPPDSAPTAGSPNEVSTLRVSPDGARLATAGPDLAVRVWSLRTGALLRTLRGHGGTIVALAWSPDGTLLASGSSDSTAIVWDVAE